MRPRSVAVAAAVLGSTLLGVCVCIDLISPKATHGVITKLAGPRWRTTGPSLVVALSTRCQTCLESLGFYRRLAERAPAAFDMVALFNDGTQDAERRLKALDLAPQYILNASFETLGIDVAPTILVLDGGGELLGRWPGKLNSLQQREVGRALHISLTDDHRPAERLDADHLSEALKDPDMVLVDSRPRSLVTDVTLENTIRMPLEEIKTRALHEIQPRARVVIFCDHCEECERKLIPEIAARSVCQRSLESFAELGFDRVAIASVTLADLNRLGIRAAPRPRWAR